MFVVTEFGIHTQISSVADRIVKRLRAAADDVALHIQFQDTSVRAHKAFKTFLLWYTNII